MIVYSLVALLICELFLEGFIYFYGRKRDDVACDVMIVLGAGLYGDQISSALKRRLKQALYYAQRYPEVQIVVSGGQGANETMSEAMAMKMYLIKQGIASTRIIMEDRSTSTYTNFLYSKALLRNDVKTIMITSCDFHMYRACRIAKHLGFIPYRNPAKSTKLNCLKYYLRESICIIKNWLINT